MKQLRNFFFLILPVLFSGACQDVVQVKLDEGSKLYVIDAFLESGYAGQPIFIRKSTAYFGDEKPEPVTNANVILYNLSKGTSYKFHYSREDRYDVFMSGNDELRMGDQYKLEVVIDGITYSALTTQSRGAKIDSISATYYDKNQLTGRPSEPYYMCTLWAKDKADNNPDYYWIKTSRDTSFLNLCIDGTGGAVKDAKEDSLYFTAPYNLLGFETYYPGGYCSVEVHAISRDTYNFLVQAVKQVQNGGMFATTPENVKSNFVTPADAKTKAVGWFSIATVAKASITVPR